jgi:serine 3-dehydrogenase
MTTKTAWITGATSGFGAAAVERFVAGGWRVIASGRRAERLQRLVAQHGAERVHAKAFDVRDEAAMRAAHAALPLEFAGIDLLVNNAGLALGTAPAQQADLAQWKQMIDTNITALVSLTHLLLSQAATPTAAATYTAAPRPSSPSSRRTCAAICTAPVCG